MGIRCDQVAGLNERAMEIIKGEEVLDYTEVGKRVYPDGREEEFERPVMKSTVENEKYSEYTGMFGDKYPLFQYCLPDGKVVREVVQESPWNSGPVFFLALANADGLWLEETLWTEKEIQENL